nr:MAG TPA: hypothetical protein [Bacteriophage sp.]
MLLLELLNIHIPQVIFSHLLLHIFQKEKLTYLNLVLNLRVPLLITLIN